MDNPILSKPTRVPQQKRGIRSKQAILDAALRVFSEHGYHGASTREIAEAAGVSVGTFYAYYPDKRELFRDACVVYYQQFNELLGAAIGKMDFQREDGFVLIKGLLHALLDAHRFQQGFHNELAVMVLSDPEFAAMSKVKREQSVQTVLALLERSNLHIPGGSKADLARVLNTTFHAVTDLLVYDTPEDEKEGVINTFTLFVSRALGSSLETPGEGLA